MPTQPSRDDEGPNSASKAPDGLTQLGKFEIIEKVGEGGMGAVYRAVQTSLKRPVAVKLLPESLAKNKSFVERFHREARAAAALSHPNLIQVYDAGEQDGMHYFAMEYIEGESLSDKVEREGPLPEQTAVAIAMCIAAALNHAWTRAKLIHRDIKPQNIMLTPDGMVKVCDLGLAKIAGEDSSLTVSGTMMGTPHFISPEQARGDSDIDTRADIYSLGGSLYFLVTGKAPYDADSSMAVMYKHINEPPPDPRAFKPELSEGLVRILLKMMAKEADQRYQNMVELYDDLERVYQGLEPIAVSLSKGRTTVIRAPTSIEADELRALRRGLWMWRVIGCVGLLVIALVGLAIWGTMKQKQQPAATRAKPSAKATTPHAEAKTGTTVKLKPKHAAETASARPDLAFAKRRVEGKAHYREMIEAQEADISRRATEQRKADEEADRQRSGTRAANTARLTAEEAYRDFLKVWQPLVAQRDYPNAIVAAQNAVNDKDFAPLKEQMESHLAMSQALKAHEEKFRQALPTLKGKPLTFGGISGTVSGADERSLTIEKVAGVGRAFPLAGMGPQDLLPLILTTLGENNPETLTYAGLLSLAEGHTEWARTYLEKAKLLDTTGAAKTAADRFDDLREVMERVPTEAAAAAALEEVQGLVTAAKWQDAGVKLAVASKQFADTTTMKYSVERVQSMQEAIIAAEGGTVETGAQFSLDRLRRDVETKDWKRAAETLKYLDQRYAKTETMKNARDLVELRDQVESHAAPPASKLPGPTLRETVAARPGATVHRLAPKTAGRPELLGELMSNVKDGDGIELDDGIYAWLAGPRALKDISVFAKRGALPLIVLGAPKFGDSTLRLEASNGLWRFEGLIIGTLGPPAPGLAEKNAAARPAIELGPGASAEFSQCMLNVRKRDSSEVPLFRCAGDGELVLRNCVLGLGRGIELLGPQRASLTHCSGSGASLFLLGDRFPADKSCAIKLVNNVVFADSPAGLVDGATVTENRVAAKLSDVLNRLNLEGSHHNVVMLSRSARLNGWRDVLEKQLTGSNFVGAIDDEPPLAAAINRPQMDLRLRPDCPAYRAADDGLMVGVRWPDEFFSKVSQHSLMSIKGVGQRPRGRDAP